MVPSHQVGVCELLIRVVLLNKVLNDRPRLPQGKIGVRVLDGGVAPIRIDVRERPLLYVLKLERVDLVWNGEFLENDNYLPRIRTRCFVD